ncbi:MAG: acetyl-CoA carboxylase biotin carboxyl carrier protein [Candidatus Kapabacteria bacterium]|nr:acetyl-CoA carboxylase biotin carboxyl carrier protein [Candidatus Kapabacteria bacterium]
MDLDYLKKLVNIFDDSKAEELEIEEEGAVIRLSKRNQPDNSNNQGTVINLSAGGGFAAPTSVQPIQTQSNASTPVVVQEAPKVAVASNLHEIKSPIVGTFYRAPSPDSDSFVEVGSRVSVGTALCIIEAMKLMNEIESDVSGTIESILVASGQPIEYNQPLFTIKLD